MSRKQIHFVHANGFPSRTYSTLFGYLEEDFEIGYLERHGHDPDFPVSDNWEHLARELEATLDSEYDSPVIGVGHSLGGVLHLLAAAERPELYSSIVLLDSPIISRASSYGIRLLKRAELFRHVSPARKARTRRNSFGSKEEAFRHFGATARFGSFDSRVLADYVEFGLEEARGGFRLSFEPEIEAEIYATLPDHLPELEGKLKVPTAYIGGTRSREARLARLGFMKKRFPITFLEIEGSHLFPMEKPEETAAMIRSVLRSQTPSAAA